MRRPNRLLLGLPSTSAAPPDRRWSTAVLVTILLSAALLPAAHAQRQPGSTGFGFQVGLPGGASVKVYRTETVAYDAILTTDADDYVASHVHRLWERPLPDSPLHLYVGPGAVIGLQTLTASPQIRLGVSGEVGLNFYAERFEVFLHVTPTLRFFPNRVASLDGNVGLRYYFSLQ